MENSLHTQKVEILSRLIKESSLTLEEALLLLKDEEPVEPTQVPYTPLPYKTWNPGMGTSTGLNPHLGSIQTTPLQNGGYGTINTLNSTNLLSGNSTTTTLLKTHATYTADLNT